MSSIGKKRLRTKEKGDVGAITVEENSHKGVFLDVRVSSIPKGVDGGEVTWVVRQHLLGERINIHTLSIAPSLLSIVREQYGEYCRDECEVLRIYSQEATPESVERLLNKTLKTEWSIPYVHVGSVSSGLKGLSKRRFKDVELDVFIDPVDMEFKVIESDCPQPVKKVPVTVKRPGFIFDMSQNWEWLRVLSSTSQGNTSEEFTLIVCGHDEKASVSRIASRLGLLYWIIDYNDVCSTEGLENAVSNMDGPYRMVFLNMSRNLSVWDEKYNRLEECASSFASVMKYVPGPRQLIVDIDLCYTEYKNSVIARLFGYESELDVFYYFEKEKLILKAPHSQRLEELCNIHGSTIPTTQWHTQELTPYDKKCPICFEAMLDADGNSLLPTVAFSCPVVKSGKAHMLCAYCATSAMDSGSPITCCPACRCSSTLRHCLLKGHHFNKKGVYHIPEFVQKAAELGIGTAIVLPEDDDATRLFMHKLLAQKSIGYQLGVRDSYTFIPVLKKRLETSIVINLRRLSPSSFLYSLFSCSVKNKKWLLHWGVEPEHEYGPYDECKCLNFYNDSITLPTETEVETQIDNYIRAIPY